MENGKEHYNIIHFENDSPNPSSSCQNHHEDNDRISRINLSSNSSGISSSRAFSNLSLDSTSNYALSSCISFSASESDSGDGLETGGERTLATFRRNSFGDRMVQTKEEFRARRPNSFEEICTSSGSNNNKNTGPVLPSAPFLKPILKKTPSFDSSRNERRRHSDAVNLSCYKGSNYDDGIKLKGILKNRDSAVAYDSSARYPSADLHSRRKTHQQHHRFVSTEDLSVTNCLSPEVGRAKSTSLDYTAQRETDGSYPLNAIAIKGILKNKTYHVTGIPKTTDDGGTQTVGRRDVTLDDVNVNYCGTGSTTFSICPKATPNKILAIGPRGPVGVRTPKKGILKSRYYGSKSLPGIYTAGCDGPRQRSIEVPKLNGILKHKMAAAFASPGSSPSSRHITADDPPYPSHRPTSRDIGAARRVQPAYTDRRYSNPLSGYAAPKGILKKPIAASDAAKIAHDQGGSCNGQNVYLDTVIATSLRHALKLDAHPDHGGGAANDEHYPPSSQAYPFPVKSILKNKYRPS